MKVGVCNLSNRCKTHYVMKNSTIPRESTYICAVFPKEIIVIAVDLASMNCMKNGQRHKIRALELASRPSTTLLLKVLMSVISVLLQKKISWKKLKTRRVMAKKPRKTHILTLTTVENRSRDRPLR